MSDRALPRLLASARRAIDEERSLVLATVVATEGSTYRKAGARMLITGEGVLDGVLGGGCFDTDLVEQARRVLQDGTCRLVEYDMRSPDDVVWGLGLGCEGLVRVFLQPLAAASTTLARLEGLAAKPDGGSLLTLVGPDDHQQLGESWRPDEDPLPGELGELVQARPPDHGLLPDPSGRFTLFAEVVRPAPVLAICGAGVDAVPVAALANDVGWRVVVFDERPGHVRPDRFPAGCTVRAFAGDDADLARAEAILVMSHSHEGDLRYLRAVAGHDASWIGVLGPTARRERLLEALAERDGEAADALSSRLRGPVGLDLGGELPEEIALSVLAELQASHYGRDAAPFTGAGRK